MLKFRPHHFLCTLGFVGKGYSEEFVQNFQKIADSLRKAGRQGDEVEIEVVSHTDSICQPCPNRMETRCTSEVKIQALDLAHSKVLGLNSGDKLSWGDAKALLAERFTVEEFEKACAPCAWKSLGVCKSALLRLKEEKQNGKDEKAQP